MLSEADLGIGQAVADVATVRLIQGRAVATGEQLATQLQTALGSPVAATTALAETLHLLEREPDSMASCVDGSGDGHCQGGQPDEAAACNSR